LFSDEDPQQRTEARPPKIAARINTGRPAADKDMTMTIRKIIFSVAAAAAALTSAVPAAAQEVEKVQIFHGDLNLGSKAGIATFNRRVVRAAEQLCGVSSAQNLVMIARTKACHAEILSSADAQRSALIASSTTYAQANVPAAKAR
jgi:UrcA family protein